MNDHCNSANLAKAKRRLAVGVSQAPSSGRERTYHDTSSDSICVNRFGREQEELAILEVSVDIAERTLRIEKSIDIIYLLAIAVTGNNTRGQALQHSRHLPSSCATLGVTEKTLLSDDWYSISWCPADRSEDVVPDAGLVLLL